MKSLKIPTPETVDKAVANMPRLEQQRYFFARLENPNWIEPLRRKGFFSMPPEGIKHEAEGTIEVQQWPASSYLSRMANLAPNEVCEVFLKMLDTQNPFIIRDIFDAALAMPPEIAEKLAPKIAKLIQSHFLIRPERAGELAVNLARGGKKQAALTVLRSALEILPDARPVPEELKSFDPKYRHEARTKIRDYGYGLILQRNTSDLTNYLGIDFFSLLCDLLEKALRIESRSAGDEQEKIEDYSYIWQTHLGSGGGGIESPKRLLVSPILISAEQISSSGIQAFSEVRSSLSTRQYKIFERIELELLARHPGKVISAVAEKLTDRTLFDDVGVRPEYYALSEKAFGLISQTQQEQILKWIDEGLNHKNLEERGFSREEAEDVIVRWRLDRLSPIRQYLSPDWQKRYDGLLEQFGAPTHPQYPVQRSGVFSVGTKSPKAEEELESMSIVEVIGYLKSWNPGEENPLLFGRPSPEGLGAVLSVLVAKKAADFSEHALEFQETDPTYARSALQGFENAVRSSKCFSWQRVLELCSWVVSQPVVIPGRTGSIETKDPDWMWTLGAIVSLIEEGFKSKAIPFSLREAVWNVIEGLSKAEELSRGDFDYRNAESQEKDIWSASINRVKPRAIRSAVKYIEWCRDNLGQQSFSLENVPEAKTLLEQHLDPTIDPAVDVRLIYGEFLPFLAYADEKWVSGNVDRIFPAQPELSPLKDVAWVAYLSANPAYDRAFEILRDLYASAINEIDKPRHVGDGHLLEDADTSLGQHFMQLYWRGLIGVEAEGIVSQFFSRAGDSLREHTIAFVGRSLNPAEVSPEILNRLTLLWDYRLANAPSPDHTKEMAAFGWWFISGCFEDNWALEHLHKSLQLSKGDMEPKLNTLDRLSRLADKHPDLVIACTELIISADYENVILWVQELTQILSVALKSGSPTASKTAENIINKLGTRGDHQYRSLLR